MHEASLAELILQEIDRKFRRTPNAAAATSVHVIVGECRDVGIVSLAAAFDNLKSLYQSCRQCHLQAEMVGALARCRGNEHIYHPCRANAFCCTECGAGVGDMLAGEELDIVAITFAALPLGAAEKPYARAQNHAIIPAKLAVSPFD